MSIPQLPSIEAIANNTSSTELKLAGWDRLRFYLRLIELLLSTITSAFVFRCLYTSKFQPGTTYDASTEIGIVFSHHYYYLTIGIMCLIYSFFAMIQTLAQGHQYLLPKWLVFSYISADSFFIINWIVAANLLLVGNPIGTSSSDSSTYLTLRLVACSLAKDYPYDWVIKTPEKLDYPLICTFSTVSSILAYFVLSSFILSLILTLYLRYQWKQLRV